MQSPIGIIAIGIIPSVKAMELRKGVAKPSTRPESLAAVRYGPTA
jgi:hypothetical protein